MMTKAQTVPADHVFLDLEDAVAPSAKVNARSAVIEALHEGDWGEKTIAVRINDCSSPWALRDLEGIVVGAGGHIDAIVVPKVQSPSQVNFVDHVLTQLESESQLVVGSIGLELQIEDALGLIEIRDILSASRRTEAVIFGPGDMSAALGSPGLTIGGYDSSYPGDQWHYVLSMILVHARAAGVQAIDGPFARVRDLDGFRDSALRSRALGYDGKWVLHPGQIEAANEIYGVSLEHFEQACDILDAYDRATDDMGHGAVLHDNEMIDEATRKMAESNYQRGLAQGFTVRSLLGDASPQEHGSRR
jgi:citrate lyase subunit beta/citryl-CoA lyase